MPAAAPIQQTERTGIKLAAACIKQGMWLESHYLASLLPLKSVTKLKLTTESIFGANRSLLPLKSVTKLKLTTNLKLSTESIFGANRSSLPSRLEMHADNAKIHRDSPTNIKHESALA
jgi:hypothetical protein